MNFNGVWCEDLDGYFIKIGFLKNEIIYQKSIRGYILYQRPKVNEQRNQVKLTFKDGSNR